MPVSSLDDDNSIIHCDLLIKEYLSWRGFARTLTNFETDRKLDKNKAFQTDRIVDQLFTFLKNYDIQSFMDYWKYLEKTFFPKLYESSGFQKTTPNVGSDQYMEQQQQQQLGSSSSSIDASSSGSIPSSTSQLDLMSNNSSSMNVSTSTNELGASSVNASISSSGSSAVSSSSQSIVNPSSSSLNNNNNGSSMVAPIGSLLGRHASSSTSSYYETIRKLEQSLKKFYVVNCAQNRRIKECREFFERFGHELIQEQEWRPWFALPYLLAQTDKGLTTSNHSTPRSFNLDGADTSVMSSNSERERRESNAPLLQSHSSNVLSIIEQFVPELEPFFNHKWAEMLYVCVQNFIATAMMSVEKPNLLLMESEKRDRLNVLKKKLDVLISENETLKSKLLAAEAYISKLEQEVGIRREAGIPSASSTLDISDLPQENVNNSDSGSMGAVRTPRNKSFHQSFSSLNISSVRQNSSNSLATPQRSALSPNSPNTTNASNTTPTEQITTSVFDNIQLFNLKPVYPAKVFTGHKDYVTSLKFSQDGKYLASSSKDNTVRIWSLSGNNSNNSSSVSSIQTYECGTKAMCIDWWSASNGKKGSSNNMVVCGLNNRKVKILDLDKRKCTGEFCTEIFFPKVNAIACCGSTIRNSDYCVVSCSSYQKSDSGSNTPVPLLPSSAGGNSSPSSSVSGMLLGYNLNHMKLENKFVIQPKSVPILDIKFNHNGTMIATAGSDGFVRIFDTASKQQQPIWTWKAHDGEVTNVHFSENETSVLTCGSDGKLIEWSIHNTGKVLNQIQLQNPVSFGCEKHANWIDTRIGLCSTSERMFVLNYPGVIFSLLHNSPTHCLMTKDLYSSTQNNNATITAQDFSPMTNVDWFNAAFGGASGNTYQYLNWIAASHGLNNNIYLYNMDLS